MLYTLYNILLCMLIYMSNTRYVPNIYFCYIPFSLLYGIDHQFYYTAGFCNYKLLKNILFNMVNNA